MTRVFTEDHEGGSNGAALTTSNTTYSALTGGPTFTTEAVHGSLAARCQAAASVVSTQVDFTGTSLRGERRYFIVKNLPTGTMLLPILRFRIGGGTIIAELRVTTTGQLVLRNATGIVATSTATVTVDQPFGVDMLVDTGAVNTSQVRLYMTPGSGDLTETLSGAAGEGAFTRVTAGALDVTYTGTVIVDSAAADDAGFVGPLITNVAPTVSAGVDQADVEPWSTVTLAGTDADTDGTIVTRGWSQTGGTPTVTLSGTGATRTFEAPATIAGTTLTFTYSATDNLGSTATDTMTVTVTAVDARTAVGGSWVPTRFELLTGTLDPGDPGDPPPVDHPEPTSPAIGHSWLMQSRTPSYAPDLTLPIMSAKFVRRHMGVDTAIAETPYSPERWASLAPSCGLILTRDGVQEFTGRLVARDIEWDAGNGRATIKLEAQGDERGLAGRLVFPDPLRAADDQTVNDYWTYTGLASTAMLRLISDQAGPTCRTARQIPGLGLGDDPGVGKSRKWTGLFEPKVLDQLALMSVASGANLGLRITSVPGELTAHIRAPRDRAASIKFSADLSNVVGFTYREEAPTVTHAVAGGQGDLHLRLRKRAETTDPVALQWGEQQWAYVDRRDTADAADLLQAALDAVAEGGPTVSLSVTLTDSQAATYGRDWELGDKVTVYVGLPGQTKPTTVSDVVREILFEVDASGAEKIQPAFGSYDAKAVLRTPTQRQLAAVGIGLAGLAARK